MEEFFKFLLSGFFKVVSALDTNKQNKQLIKYQNELNMQNWETQTAHNEAYNAPDAQIERLKKAGINPNSMLMGNGTAQMSNGNVADPIQSAQPIPYQDVLSLASNSMLQSMSAFKSMNEGLTDLSLRQERIINQRSQNDLLRSQIQGMDLSNESQQIINKYLDAKEAWTVAGMKSNVKLTNAQRMEANQRIKNMRYELTHILPASLQESISRKELNVMSIDEVMARIADLNASAGLKRQQTEQSAAQTELTQAQTELTQEQEQHQELENINYQELTDTYLRKYRAEIDQLAAQTGLTQEQAEWYVIDKVNDMSISIFGTKIPAARFGPAPVRHATNRQVEKSFNKHSDKKYNTYYAN